MDKILPKSFLLDFLAHQYIYLLGLKGKDFHNHDHDPSSKQLWFVSTSSLLFQLRWKRSEMTKFLISEHKQRKIQPETNKERKQSNNPKYSTVNRTAMFCVSLAWNAGRQIVTLSEEGQIQGGLYRAVDMPLGPSEI